MNTTDANYDISIDGSINQNGYASANGSNLVYGRNIDLGRTNAENEGESIWYMQPEINVSTPNAFVDFVGKIIASGSSYTLKGDIAEIILLDYVPTAEVRRKIEIYLQNKWNTPALP